MRGTFRALTQVATLYNIKAVTLCPLLRTEAKALVESAVRVLPFSYALIPKTMALVAKLSPGVSDLQNKSGALEPSGVSL